LGVADGTPVLLTAGRLEPEKGHRYLLRALPRLLAAHPRLRLWLAGEGSLCEALRREAARLGLADAVDFLGYRADVPSLLAACDLLVVPSLEESFCLTLLEAMALGRPVVAARVGGIPEVAVEGETAWLVPPADPEALAEAVADALARPEEAARRGEAGARRARERFQISAMVAGFAQVYQRVLASPA
jgi:glycosyltransferase involved in cell wall biosynthesis